MRIVKAASTKPKPGGRGGAVGVFIKLFIVVALALAATGCGLLFRRANLQESNIVSAYILAVVLASWLSNSITYGIFASLLCTLFFNYFFTAPLYTLAVNDPNYFVTFFIMTMTALVTGMLTSHAVKSAMQAHQRENEAKAIAKLTNLLTDADNPAEIAAITAIAMVDCLGFPIGFLCCDPSGYPQEEYRLQLSHQRFEMRPTLERQALASYFSKRPAQPLQSGEYIDWPLVGSEGLLGIVRISHHEDQRIKSGQERLLHALMESAILAMDRLRSTLQRQRSEEEKIEERSRSSLLRAISHDLRTPLSGIIGISEMQMSILQKTHPCYALAQGIHKDAQWLHAMVENILSLTRLQEGKLLINKQPEAAEEIVGGAIRHMAARAPEHEITVDVPEQLLMVPMDARLIEQVLINLLDNAVRYTKPGKEIHISVKEDAAAKQAVFVVSDQGSGIAPDILPGIFDLFYAMPASRADAGPCIGLGLAICDAVVKAHGGEISAANRGESGGAQFRFTLPLEK